MNLVITLTFKILILVIIGYIAKVIGIIDDVEPEEFEEAKQFLKDTQELTHDYQEKEFEF